MANTSEAGQAHETHEHNQPEARDPNSLGSRLRSAAPHSAQDARNIGERAADAAARAADAAAELTRDMTRQAADQGQEAVRLGLRAVAGAQIPLGDVSYDQSRRLLETLARVTDVYRDAAERTAEDVQTLVGAYSNIGRGLQQYQQACFDLLSRSMESMARKRQGLFQVNSPVESAEIRRDIYLDTMNNLFTASTILLQLVEQIAQSAVRPLQERMRVHTQG